MATLNKVFLIGNVTRDPELRYVQTGTPVMDLSLAVNRRTRAGDGSLREETTFVEITVWGKMAESCAEYLSKGKSVLVEGYLRLDQWDDKKTGEKRSKLRVTAERVQFLSPRPPGAAGGAGPGAGAAASSSGAPASRPAPAAPAAGAEPVAEPNEQQQQQQQQQQQLTDDDIPF